MIWRAGGNDHRAVKLGTQRAIWFNAYQRAVVVTVFCCGRVVSADGCWGSRRGRHYGRWAGENAVVVSLAVENPESTAPEELDGRGLQRKNTAIYSPAGHDRHGTGDRRELHDVLKSGA